MVRVLGPDLFNALADLASFLFVRFKFIGLGVLGQPYLWLTLRVADHAFVLFDLEGSEKGELLLRNIAIWLRFALFFCLDFGPYRKRRQHLAVLFYF